MSTLTRVRVEDATSIGRSYSAKGEVVRGLGESRRKLTSTAWRAAADAHGDISISSYTLAKCHHARATRDDVQAYFDNTWDLTTALFTCLRTDAGFYAIPDVLRRPLIFYAAHPAALYANKMHQAGLIDAVHPYYQKLFETGVDEMSWDDMDVMQDEDFAWPSVEDMMSFRARVKEAVDAAIQRMPHPCEVPVTPASPYWSLFMGFEHERIHIETSSVLIRQLPIDMVQTPKGWRTAPSLAPTPDAAPVNELVPVEAGTAVLGKPTSFPSFGWDNEYGQRKVEVPAFSGSKLLVSNAEFLPFVLAGGYKNSAWWISEAGDDEGWRWCSFRNATHPSFWVATSHADMLQYHGGKQGYPYQKDDGHARAGAGAKFMLRTMFDIVDMPWDWPVEVNYLEAAAFLRWKAASEGLPASAYRMPTEAEFHIMRDDPSPYEGATTGLQPGALAGARTLEPLIKTESNGVVQLPCGGVDEAVGRDASDAAARADIMMQPSGPGNVNLRWGSPTPVNMYAPSPKGFHDMHGNVWQWVEDHFAPLPGFEIHYLYDDFSSPCFDGWHTLILGGSWVSTGQLASSFARYHFRRHFFQQLGFRYVKVEAPEPYRGAATVANLWEGMSTVSNDITDGFAMPSERLPYAKELVATDNAMAYAINVAQWAAAAYTAHVGSRAPATAAAPASSDAPDSALASARVLLLGSRVGAVAFELTRAGFASVTGVDEDEASVRHARILQHHGQFEYERVREGVLTDKALVKIHPDVKRGCASFVHADPRSLPSTLLAAGRFDLVLVDSLLCKQRQPLDLLAKLAQYVAVGGLLLITSSNSWLPDVTPRNSWLGGFKMNGEDMTTLHMLKHHLSRHNFRFLESCDIPRMTRNHARSFTFEVLEASVWQLNSTA